MRFTNMKKVPSPGRLHAEKLLELAYQLRSRASINPDPYRADHLRRSAEGLELAAARFTVSSNMIVVATALQAQPVRALPEFDRGSGMVALKSASVS